MVLVLDNLNKTWLTIEVDITQQIKSIDIKNKDN